MNASIIYAKKNILYIRISLYLVRFTYSFKLSFNCCYSIIMHFYFSKAFEAELIYEN